MLVDQFVLHYNLLEGIIGVALCLITLEDGTDYPMPAGPAPPDDHGGPERLL